MRRAATVGLRERRAARAGAGPRPPVAKRAGAFPPARQGGRGGAGRRCLPARSERQRKAGLPAVLRSAVGSQRGRQKVPFRPGSGSSGGSLLLGEFREIPRQKDCFRGPCRDSGGGWTGCSDTGVCRGSWARKVAGLPQRSLRRSGAGRTVPSAPGPWGWKTTDRGAAGGLSPRPGKSS